MLAQRRRVLVVVQSDNAASLATHCSIISSGRRSKGGGDIGCFSILERRPSVVVEASMTLALYSEDLQSMSDGAEAETVETWSKEKSGWVWGVRGTVADVKSTATTVGTG